MVLVSSINIKGGSNAMRLVKGVWQPQLGIDSQTSHFPGECATIVHHCDSLVHTLLYWAGGTEVPQSQHLAATPCAIRTPFGVDQKHLSFRGEAM